PDGAVPPSKVGDVATVAGTYGQAWRYTATGQRMEVANVGYLDRNAGTVIVRARFEASVGSGSQAVLSTTSEACRVTLQRISNNRLQRYIGTPVSSAVSGNNAIPDDTLVTLAFAWANGSVSLYVNGAPVGTGTFTTGSANPATLYTALSGGVYPYQAESYLFFDDRLPDDEIARISGLNEAHTIATVTVGGDLVLPSQRTVLGTEGGSALSLRSPSNALMDLTVSDDGTLLLDGREVGGATSSPLIVTKAGDDVTITTPLTGAGTLEIWTDHGDPGQNDVFNFANTKLDGTVIHANGDDAAPVRMPSAVGANHGYTNIRAYTVAGHDKTTADLGSVYTDETSEYTLLAISGNDLTFGYPYTVGGNGVTVPGTTAPAATLTHVSGGTN